MSEHARLSCSSAARWSECPGSVREEAAYPDISGAAAIDGTGTHLLVELSIVNQQAPATFVGTIIGANHEDMPNGWMVDAARAERAAVCTDYLARRIAELSKEFPHSKVTYEAESKTNPGAACVPPRDDWWGTADLTITCTAPDGSVNFLEVCDYKDGRSYVNPTDNPQLISYLSGKLYQYSYVADCRMSIVQPKTHPPIRYQDLLPDNVVMQHARLAADAVLTDDPNAPLIAGKWCKWCKHTNCTIEAGEAIMTLEATNLDLLKGDVTALNNEQLSELCSAKAAITSIFDKAETELMTRLQRGDTISGYVIGHGPTRRVWSQDEDEIVKMLKNRKFKQTDYYPPKLISPAQVMKSTLLTDVQKTGIAKNFIAEIEGKESLKQVAHVATQPSTIPSFL